MHTRVMSPQSSKILSGDCAGLDVPGRGQAYSLGGENMHYGTPVNPACPDRVPGGSSSGSAVRSRLPGLRRRQTEPNAGGAPAECVHFQGGFVSYRI